jgi:hypothetical protein
MEQLQSNIKMKIGTSNPFWSWGARHAAWLLNRYKPVRGATPYELVHGMAYRGVLAAFAEPMCAYYKTSLKCEKKWHRSRQRIFLTRSVRCVGQSWGLSLPFYKFFSAPSYDYQTGFGARIVPTKREALALPTSTAMIPFESIVTKFRDHEAEAVAEKAAEQTKLWRWQRCQRQTIHRKLFWFLLKMKISLKVHPRRTSWWRRWQFKSQKMCKRKRLWR